MNLQYSQTTKYDQFKTIPGNRPIKHEHVQFIKKSIKTSNKLEFNPIIVSGDYFIVDGQHRLKAAEELKLPIYFVVDKNARPEDMVLLNTPRRNWTLENYIYYHYQNGNPEYAFIYEMWNLARQYFSTFSAFYVMMKYFNGASNYEFSQVFKEGTLTIKDKSQIENFIKESFPKMKRINSLIGKLPEKISKTLFFKTNFVHVLCTLFKKMNKKQYAELWKCIIRDYHLYRDRSSLELLMMFEKSYNIKKSVNHFDFTELKNAYYKKTAA